MIERIKEAGVGRRTRPLAPIALWPLVVALLVVALPPAPMAAQSAPNCAAGERPDYKPPIQPLSDKIFSVMSSPTDCARLEPNGDTVQPTRKGVARHSAATGVVGYSDSSGRQWALSPARPNIVLHWLGGPNVPAELLKGPPDSMGIRVPANARIQSIAWVDLTGDGVADWAVYYMVSRQPDNNYFGDGWVALAATNQGSAPFIFGGEYLNVSTLELLQLGGLTAVALHSFVGAHGSQLQIARWDGARFSEIFSGNSNSPSLFMSDLDGDGVVEIVDYWSPYCGSYAASPRLVTIHRWDGARFTEATSQYPGEVRQALDAFQEMIGRYDKTGTFSDEDRACFAWGQGYLAERLGDIDAATAFYQTAIQLDPTYDLGAHSVVPLARDRATPVGVVTLFYQMIARQQYVRAYYSKLSRAYQQANPYDAWRRGYDTTVEVSLLYVRPGSAQSVVEFGVAATDRTPNGLVKRNFVGVWRLVNENGAWQMDSATVEIAP